MNSRKLETFFVQQARRFSQWFSSLWGIRVLFDLDGVLCASQNKIVSKANSRLGTRFRVNHWGGPGPNIFEKISFICGQTPDNVASWLFHTDVMCSAKPIPGSQAFVRRIYMHGAQMGIATARPDFQRDATVKWVHYYFPYFKENNIRLRSTDEEGRLPEIAEFKAQQIKEFCPAVYIEDTCGVAVKLATKCTFPFSVQICLVDRPWNWYERIPPGTTTVARLGDFAKKDFAWQELFTVIREAAQQLKSSG